MNSTLNSNSKVGDHSPQPPPFLCALQDSIDLNNDQDQATRDPQLQRDLYNTYQDLAFKAIRCKGYHPQYNPKRDYRTAKEPVDAGFTKETYIAPSLPEIENWEGQLGWTGWLIPKGYMALDVEDPWSIKYLEGHFIATGVKPLIHVTNNGKHYIFKMKGDLPANTEVYTRLGVKVTYRVGGKNYLILAPINGRGWEL